MTRYTSTDLEAKGYVFDAHTNTYKHKVPREARRAATEIKQAKVVHEVASTPVRCERGTTGTSRATCGACGQPLPKGEHGKDNASSKRGGTSEQERDESSALVGQGEGQAGMESAHVKYHITITRQYSGRGRPYDDDNLSGGIKELRDTIAKYLGLAGDSEEDGVKFYYAQEKGYQTQTIIEIETKEIEGE